MIPALRLFKSLAGIFENLNLRRARNTVWGEIKVADVQLYTFAPSHEMDRSYIVYIKGGNDILLFFGCAKGDSFGGAWPCRGYLTAITIRWP